MNVSKRVSKIAPSATLAISALAKRLQAEGKDVIGFGAGEPDFDTPEFIKDAAKKALDEGFTKYTDTSGIVELRKAVAEKYLREYGVTYAPEQIIISNGGKHALSNIFQALVNPGDEVILPVPYWVSYEEQIKLAGGKVVYMPMVDLRITAAQVEKYCTDKTVALVLNSLSNPTGMLCGRAEMQKIGELACQNNFTVISDEVYEHLIYDGKQFTCMASLSKDIYEHTVVTSAVSKTYSMTGWRIGWSASPLPLANAIGNLQSHTTSNPNSIAQKAALAALTGSREFLTVWLRSFDERRHLMIDNLNQCKGITCILPEGAFYAFPDISGTGMTGMKLSKRLLEDAGVAVVPGEAFGDGNHVRLSFATSREHIEEGMKRIKKFCGEL